MITTFAPTQVEPYERRSIKTTEENKWKTTQQKHACVPPSPPTVCTSLTLLSLIFCLSPSARGVSFHHPFVSLQFHANQNVTDPAQIKKLIERAQKDLKVRGDRGEEMDIGAHDECTARGIEVHRIHTHLHSHIALVWCHSIQMLQRQSLINQLYSAGDSIIEKSLASSSPSSLHSSFTFKSGPASHSSPFQAWLAQAGVDSHNQPAEQSQNQHKFDEQKTPTLGGPMPEN